MLPSPGTYFSRGNSQRQGRWQKFSKGNSQGGGEVGCAPRRGWKGKNFPGGQLSASRGANIFQRGQLGAGSWGSSTRRRHQWLNYAPQKGFFWEEQCPTKGRRFYLDHNLYEMNKTKHKTQNKISPAALQQNQKYFFAVGRGEHFFQGRLFLFWGQFE